jgi:hypothetical protein
MNVNKSVNPLGFYLNPNENINRYDTYNSLSLSTVNTNKSTSKIIYRQHPNIPIGQPVISNGSMINSP